MGGASRKNKENMQTSWNLTTDLTKTFIHFYLENHPRTCKWLRSPPFTSHGVRPFGRGPTTRSLGDLNEPWLLTTSDLTGMILQATSKPSLNIVNILYKWPYKWLTGVITYTTPYILPSAPSISTPPPLRPFQPLPGKKLHHVTKVSASMSPSSSSATSPHRSRRR